MYGGESNKSIGMRQTALGHKLARDAIVGVALDGRDDGLVDAALVEVLEKEIDAGIEMAAKSSGSGIFN